MAAEHTLIRKQYYVSPDQVAKLAAMEKSGRFNSSAQALRAAIDAFDPDAAAGDAGNAALEAVFEQMGVALRSARRQLATARRQLREQEAEREQALEAERERVRAYYRRHPGELAAIADMLRER